MKQGDTPEGGKRQRTFWLADDGRYLGQVQIRYEPAGPVGFENHIYYEVRPSERGRGYGRELLRLALNEARQMGLVELLVAVEASNVASQRVVEANGGVLLKAAEEPSSPALYRIDLRS